MPVTVKTGQRNPYDSGGPLKLDISEEIDTLVPEGQTPFLSYLGWGKSAEDIASASMGADSLRNPCVSVKHSWLNDVLVPTSGTITAGYTSAGGTITVGATQVLYFAVDDIIRVKSTAAGVSTVNSDVFYIITSINTGAGTFAVTVLNTDQDLANGDTWYKMGNAKTVGSSVATSGVHTVLTQVDNYTQIFDTYAKVTGTEQSQAQYGITDPFGREIEKATQRLIVEFERACMFGYRVSAIPSSSSTASRMGGMFYYTRVQSGGLAADLAGAEISENALDGYIDTMWRAGGTPDTIMVSGTTLRSLKKFLRPFVHTPRTERAAGLVMDRYDSVLGFSLDVILNRHLNEGDLVITTKGQCGVGPLKGNGESRAFNAAEVPWNGNDNRQARLLGEYTMEVRNHTAMHYWIYGGATTVSS